MNFTCWFSNNRAISAARVGSKGANLSRLACGDFPVPPGFFITTDAYRHLLQVTGLNRVLTDLLDQIDFQDQEAVSVKSAAIRELIEQQPIPIKVAGEVLQNYIKLGRQIGCRHLEATPVAVRSSTVAEDSPEISFAGQQESYLNVRGGLSLLRHARRCWSSLWTARALTHRWRQGLDHQRVSIAVFIQAMVNPEKSGVLLTSNLITGNRNECVINASWGLGEAVISGIVSPDTFIVDCRSGRVLQQEIARKERQVVCSALAGVIEQEVCPRLQQHACLTPSQAAHLAAMATRIEQYSDAPQDIEWALANDNFYILQARPIAAVPESDAAGTLQAADLARFSGYRAG